MNDSSTIKPRKQPRAVRSTIKIISTFVADPVEDVMNYWFNEFQYQADILPTQYGQVIQHLLIAREAQDDIDINVVMFAIRDFIPVKQRRSLSHDNVHANINQFIEALSTAIDASAGVWIIMRCPDPQYDTAEINRGFDTQADHLGSAVNTLARATYIDAKQEGDKYALKSCFDDITDKHAHIPYTEDYYSVLGTLIFRAIRAYQAKPYKLIITDCDDTLWAGVCGEDGATGITIQPHHRRLHQFLLQQSSTGMLLALCSQNDSSDVHKVFEQRSELGLSLTDITSTRINWEEKADNIKDLARELNVALDSIIFLDNDPMQRNKVKAMLPEVLVPDLPSDSLEWAAYLQHIWAFDDYWTTSEASNRQIYYKQYLYRENKRASTPSMADFIAQLQLNVMIQPASKEHVARLYELSQRVSQFNLNGEQVSEAEIVRQLADNTRQWLVVHAEDRYGDYGLVGAISCQYISDECYIETFLLSCRALLRGIEVRMLQAVCEYASNKQIQQLKFRVTRTTRNAPMISFLKRLNMSGKDLDKRIYEVSTHQAISMLDQLIEPKIISNNPEQKSSMPDDGKYDYAESIIPGEADQLLAAATASFSIHALTSKIKTANELVSGSGDVVQVAPGTETEKTMLRIFQELLGHKDIGVNNEFFDSGGHSILVMRLLSRISTVFGVDLPIRTLFNEHLTIANLAEIVDSANSPGDTHAEIDVIKNTLDSFSEDELSEIFGGLGLDEKNT